MYKSNRLRIFFFYYMACSTKAMYLKYTFIIEEAKLLYLRLRVQPLYMSIIILLSKIVKFGLIIVIII